MRDRDTIDSELRRLAAARRSISGGGDLSSRQIDALLDERLGHPVDAPEVGTGSPGDKPAPYRRNGLTRRFGLLAALPLSLMAVAAALVVMFAVHRPHPAAQPAPVPPSATPPSPPVSDARPAPAAPTPPLDIVDRAFVDTMKQQDLPVPSDEYLTSHGHAVCDFLADQPDFTAAVRFVQQSSIWDAEQSTQFTAGAIASYCPQSGHARSEEVRRTLEKVLSDLQTIQGQLQGVRDGLPAIPGGQ